DTEVATCEGIERIGDVRVGDHVYSINPETFDVEIKPVIATYAQPYEGPMVEIKTSFVDYLVTPNHRFLTSKFTWGVYTHYAWETASDMLADRITRKLPPLRPLPGIPYTSESISLAAKCQRSEEHTSELQSRE